MTDTEGEHLQPEADVNVPPAADPQRPAGNEAPLRPLVSVEGDEELEVGQRRGDTSLSCLERKGQHGEQGGEGGGVLSWCVCVGVGGLVGGG